jgi:hypothetical protein
MKDHEHLQQIADRLNGVLELLSVGSDYQIKVIIVSKNGEQNGRHNFAIPEGVEILTVNGTTIPWSPRQDHNMGMTNKKAPDHSGTSSRISVS